MTQQSAISITRDDEEPHGSLAPIVIGTRGSALALYQARFVADALRSVTSEHQIQVEVITSDGDRDKTSPLSAIGGRGVFTSSLQRALTLGQVDAAVHSSKDVPSLTAQGLVLAAFPQREDARDAVVSRHGVGLLDLPPNPVVGSSSRRRAAQVLALRPDARIRELRGNIDTRLRKAQSGDYDAIILAAAGLGRMGWSDAITELLPMDVFTPAPGQGALAVETRLHPDPAYLAVQSIDQPHIRRALEVERAFLRGIGGGCSTPLGAHAQVEILHGVARVRFFGMLARDDGSGLTRVYEEWPPESAVDRAFRLAQDLVREVRPNSALGAGVERSRQLRGMNIIVTGSEHLTQRATASVHQRGGDAIPMPTIRIASPVDPGPFRDACTQLVEGTYTWAIFTSRNAIKAMDATLREAPPDAFRALVIGEETGSALRAVGREPEMVASDSTAEGVLATILPVIGPEDRVLLPVSNRARRVIAEGLVRAGASVTTVTAYRTEIIRAIDPTLEQRMARGEIGAVLLASPSAVEGFVAQAGHVLPAMSGACFVAIGPVTAQAMRDAGLPVHAMSSVPGADHMVEALTGYLWGGAQG